MYLFVSKNEVIPYSGEVLKRYVGKRLVKTIANPTDEDLKEFGYMEMLDGEMPMFDREKAICCEEYKVVDGKICRMYKINELPMPEKAEV